MARKPRITALDKFMAGTQGDFASVPMLRKVAKQKQAMEMRTAGMPYRSIAMKLGYVTELEAYNDVIAGFRLAVRETGEDLRSVELERLDELYNMAYRRALGGDVKAMKVCLDISHQRAKLIGIDRPGDGKILSDELAQLAEAMNIPVAEIQEELQALMKQHRIRNVTVEQSATADVPVNGRRKRDR